jgi:hypothetical protein
MLFETWAAVRRRRGPRLRTVVEHGGQPPGSATHPMIYKTAPSPRATAPVAASRASG